MIPMRTWPVHLAAPGALKKIIVIPSGLGFKKRQHGLLGHRLQLDVAPGAARKKRQCALKAEKRQGFH